MTLLHLRAASASDAYALWIWANDPESRKASFGRELIPWESHIVWLRAVLESPHHLLLLAVTSGDQPVGTIRFDTLDAWGTARLSYLVAPEARGRRLASALISTGLERCRHVVGRSSIVEATVDVHNERSLRVFRRLDWREAQDGRAIIFRKES